MTAWASSFFWKLLLLVFNSSSISFIFAFSCSQACVSWSRSSLYFLTYDKAKKYLAWSSFYHKCFLWKNDRMHGKRTNQYWQHTIRVVGLHMQTNLSSWYQDKQIIYYRHRFSGQYFTSLSLLSKNLYTLFYICS